MKKVNLHFLICGILILLCFNSCTTSTIVFDVLSPAEIVLPEGIEKATLVNLVTLPDNRSVDDIDELLKGRGELVNHIASQGAISGVVREMEFADNIRLHRSTLSGALKEFDDKQNIPWERLDSLCEATGKEIVIALKSFTSSTEIDYSGYERKTKSDPVKVWTNTIAYDVSTDWVYIARLKTYVDIGWIIFYPAERLIVSDPTYKDSVFTEVEGSSQSDAEKRLPGIKNAIEDAGYIAGNRFANRITPGRLTVERIYYTSGNEDFKQAQDFVKMRYWTDAAEYWKKNIDHPDPKIAAKARFNLALIYEMEGELDEAIRLVESAKEFHPAILIDEYLQLLNKRKSSPGWDPELE